MPAFKPGKNEAEPDLLLGLGMLYFHKYVYEKKSGLNNLPVRMITTSIIFVFNFLVCLLLLQISRAGHFFFCEIFYDLAK